MLMDSVKGIGNSVSIAYTADFPRRFVVVWLAIDRYERAPRSRMRIWSREIVFRDRSLASINLPGDKWYSVVDDVTRY